MRRSLQAVALAVLVLLAFDGGEARAQRATRAGAANVTARAKVPNVRRAPNARPQRNPKAKFSAKQKTSIVRLMEKGSLSLSRTATIGWRSLPPPGGDSVPVEQIAKRNFRQAAELVVDEHQTLELDLKTATRLNKLLTRDLVPKEVIGKADYYGRDPRPFYRWLGSAKAKQLQAKDPVLFAERIHIEISKLDAFPDGNGRTARLMADLALLKAGHAPAYYTEMKDYFDRGGPRNRATAAQRQSYFREIVARGDKALGMGERAGGKRPAK